MTMTTHILAKFSEMEGWSPETERDLALAYIEAQKDDGTWTAFLATVAGDPVVGAEGWVPPPINEHRRSGIERLAAELRAASRKAAIKHAAECLAQAAKHPKAAYEGARSFRSDLTLHYEDPDVLDSHDAGRELAHIVTLRRYEP